MNHITVPTNPDECLWGYPCVWQFYSGWILVGLAVTAVGQTLLVKVCRSKAFGSKPGPWLMITCIAILIAIQWRYLISACLHLPRSDFAAGKLMNENCIQSIKGGKLASHLRDCYMGEGANCTETMPCTSCNPEKGMDKAAVWNWFVQQPCRSCKKDRDLYDCGALERSTSRCALTYEGEEVIGSARFKSISKVSTFYNFRAHMPIEFWRVKHNKPCSICCQTNRTHAWRKLLQNSLRNYTEAYGVKFNHSVKLPMVEADDLENGWMTRDSDWLYSLVSRQLDIDSMWFIQDTPYPLNFSDNTTFVVNIDGVATGAIFPLNVNSYWYLP